VLATSSSPKLPLLNASSGTSGFMTTHPIERGGRSCGYADANQGGLDAPSATSPAFRRLTYCAVGIALYRGGQACGSCLRVSGSAGSLVVQIVGSGANKTLDCEPLASLAITGHTTGSQPISYEPAACETEGGAVATVLAGGNTSYTRVIFSNLPGAVKGADMILDISGRRSDSRRFRMTRATGASWEVSLPGHSGRAGFELSLEDGALVELRQCFDQWPVPTGFSCEVGTRPNPTGRIYVCGLMLLALLVYTQCCFLAQSPEAVAANVS